MDNSSFKKWSIILIALATVILFTVWIIFAISDFGKKTITINTSPLEVNVTIGDKEYGLRESGSTFRAEIDSEIAITLSREGFADTEISHIVSSEDENNIIFAALEPLTFEAQQILKSSEEVANHESVVTDSYLNLMDEMNEEFPILSELPHYGRYFTISQGLSQKNPDNPKAFALYIDVLSQFVEQGKKDALDFLESRDYNPEDFEIIYREEAYQTRGD